MSKRESESEYEMSMSKMRREDLDDGGASARSGRVRKKSAKVLEMEEFEQVEKTQHITKKGKPPKIGGRLSSDEQEITVVGKAPSLTKKMKASKSPAATSLLSSLDMTPLSSKVVKAMPGRPEFGTQLTKPVQQFLPIQTSGILSTGLATNNALSPSDLLVTTLKPEYDTDLASMSDLGLQQQLLQHSPIKSDDQKSVIKYLLSSPSSSSKPSVSTSAVTKFSSSSDTLTSGAGKKFSKLSSKPPRDQALVKKSKPRKPKAESMSPPLSTEMLAVNQIGTGLKMKIFSSTDPTSAQVSLNTHVSQAALGSQLEHQSNPKLKKPKKIKHQNPGQDLLESVDVLGLSKLDAEDLSGTPVKKVKRVSKKKEKLIQDAISAAQQMPNLAALVASQTHISGHGQGHFIAQAGGFSPGQKQHKPQKKKLVSPMTASSSGSDEPNESPGKSDLSFEDDGEEESQLVIAETEKKKKKSLTKKKMLAHKDKAGSASPKGDKADKKLSKRAPTAYMLFCNTHRPDIVSENPGIEFAGISRKLGEMWQTLSNKQKLQWRRKAQRRRKKGSNLISTGKVGKEPGSVILTPPSSAPSHHMSPGLKLTTLMQKAQRSSPEDTPQSPTKNFSIEPIDVAAHLKLLGESLSIIGMRLQEHKVTVFFQ